MAGKIVVNKSDKTYFYCFSFIYIFNKPVRWKIEMKVLKACESEN